MHVTNPAGFATAIHFYDLGQHIDNYYTEDIQSDSNLTELPQKPNEVTRILNGRFSFLLRQPRVQVYDDGTSAEVYFSVERHFPENRENRYQLGDKPDLFEIRRSRLYVPSWDHDPHPFGVVYCPGNELPEWLYEKHGVKRSAT